MLNKQAIETHSSLTPSSLVKLFQEAKIAHLSPETLQVHPGRLDLDRLEHDFGSVAVGVHSKVTDGDAKKGKNTVPMSTLVRRLRQNPNIEVGGWYEDWGGDEGVQELRAHYDELGAMYGVTNARRMPSFAQGLRSPLFAPWSKVVNFVWLGYSLGGLHFDYFDGILLQLHGTKRVVLFPRDVTDVIDGRDFVKRIPSVRFLSENAFDQVPWMRSMPYYEVELHPGDAVTIPAFAYHAALGGHDSVSVNFFLIANPQKKKHLITDLTDFTVPKVNPNTVPKYLELLASEWCFTLTGKPLLRIGPYEFF